MKLEIFFFLRHICCCIGAGPLPPLMKRQMFNSLQIRSIQVCSILTKLSVGNLEVDLWLKVYIKLKRNRVSHYDPYD